MSQFCCVHQENAQQQSRSSQAAKVVKPAKKTSTSRECACVQQEKPKRGRKPRKRECCEKSEGLAVGTPVVLQEPSYIFERDGNKTEFQAADQPLSQQNSLDEGPLRFSQLLAQDSQCSNPDGALEPDTPMLTYHRPPALRELLVQNSPASLPDAPVLSRRPRINECGRMSVGSEQMQARSGSSCSEETIRAQIVACLLDPNFRDLLTEVEKVWSDLKVFMSEDSQLVQAVGNYFKDASDGIQFWQQQIGKLLEVKK